MGEEIRSREQKKNRDRVRTTGIRRHNQPREMSAGSSGERTSQEGTVETRSAGNRGPNPGIREPQPLYEEGRTPK